MDKIADKANKSENDDKAKKIELLKQKNIDENKRNNLSLKKQLIDISEQIE